MPEDALPSVELFNPTLQALHSLGGSGTNMEIHDEVVALLGLTDSQVQLLHDPDNSQKTEIENRLSWTRTWLKRHGILDNPRVGVWALTPKGQRTRKLDPAAVAGRISRNELERKPWIGGAQSGAEAEATALVDETDTAEKWRESLYNMILQMQPDAFERLVQRILRESGFEQVEVTGRMGDGGIDGIGIFRIGGFLSFRVCFQCKRWKSPVGARTVRDFRGALMGRTDKGLIVTTGNFTREAIREARRHGVPDIDLIDGEQLIDSLKTLSLGVATQQVVVEQVTVDPDFFKNI